jgi:ribonuclease Y
MSITLAFILMGLSGLMGIAIGYIFRWLFVLSKKGSIELELKRLTMEGKEEGKKYVLQAQEEAREIIQRAEAEIKEKEEKFNRSEERLFKKEESIEQKGKELESEITAVKNKIAEIKEIREKAEAMVKERADELARVAGLSKEEALNQLTTEMEREHEGDLMVRMQKLEQSSQEKLERKAKEILTTAIHRFGNSVASDVMATAITIPSEELKGKIIGKEGRNIKAFERATGVEVIVDETPGAIILSSFDPVRRAVARLALENLIVDGRIQPAKIEEAAEKAKAEVNKIMKEKAEAAAYECGVLNLDPRVMMILGRLYFRTSYGQNVLQHSVEMAHISGMIAEELGANVQVAKAGALLHDIGKAVDHEVIGTHVEIGRRILEKFGVDKAIIQAMQSHHEEYPYETVESIIVQVADAISGGRPGARRDSVEQYIKKMADLEAIANSFEGVDKTYAISAGREVRVFVKPEKITDLQARELARNIALRIEQEMKYPGEIKVNVIRESRTIEFAR